jgi:hypothetical protein
MNNKQIIASLNEIANVLDNSGLYKEATDITNVMVKVSQQLGYSNMSTLEQMNQIPTWLARATQLSTSQATQFRDRGDNTKDQNPGWDYIRGLKTKGLYPGVYAELKNQWIQHTQDGLATRKETKEKTMVPPKFTGVSNPQVDLEAKKLASEALKDRSGNAWTKFTNMLSTHPLFANNPNAIIRAKEVFYYYLQGQGRA